MLVIYTLELLGLPFTGPTTTLYDPPKEVMKFVAYSEGIATPAYALVTPGQDLAKAVAHLRYPLFVKPAHAGDSLGVDAQSLVSGLEQLSRKVTALWQEYPEVLVEEYIDGREFTAVEFPCRKQSPVASMSTFTAQSLTDWFKLAPQPRPLTGKDEWNVFLSYRSVDRPWTRNLYDMLTQHGYKACIDQCALLAGSELTARLQQPLQASQSGVLIWSSRHERVRLGNKGIQHPGEHGQHETRVLLRPRARRPFGAAAVYRESRLSRF